MLPYVETGHGLSKLRTGIEIGVSDAAILGPEVFKNVRRFPDLLIRVSNFRMSLLLGRISWLIR